MATLRLIKFSRIWNNHYIALSLDPVFGVTVLAEGGWTPWSEGSPEEQEHVRSLVLKDSQFLPDQIRDTLFHQKS